MNLTKLALCLSPLLLTACVVGNKGTVQVSRHVTIGQELSDLKTALDDGSITLSEYQSLRAKIFEAVDGWTRGGDWDGIMEIEVDEASSHATSSRTAPSNDETSGPR